MRSFVATPNFLIPPQKTTTLYTARTKYIISTVWEISMSSAIETIRYVSKDLGMNEDTLVQESIIEYLKSRIKLCMTDRLEIISRYQISSLDEFERKVEDGTISEHPGWEDLITFENLEHTISKLKMELSHVRDVSTS